MSYIATVSVNFPTGQSTLDLVAVHALFFWMLRLIASSFGSEPLVEWAYGQFLKLRRRSSRSAGVCRERAAQDSNAAGTNNRAENLRIASVYLFASPP